MGRVKTTSWFEVPHKLKSSLYDMGPETWILPSLFRILRLLLPEGPRAREVAGQPADGDGKGAGFYTRLDNLGNPRTGYKSGFGDIPDLLYTNQNLIDAEFRDEDFIGFPKADS